MDAFKHTEHQLDALIKYQRAIEAMDCAIAEEKRSAEIAAGVRGWQASDDDRRAHFGSGTAPSVAQPTFTRGDYNFEEPDPKPGGAALRGACA